MKKYVLFVLTAGVLFAPPVLAEEKLGQALLSDMSAASLRCGRSTEVKASMPAPKGEKEKKAEKGVAIAVELVAR